VIRVMLFNAEGGTRSGGEKLLDNTGPRWVNVIAPSSEEMAKLSKLYGLHPLAVEDCLRLDQRPKLEQYAGHFFIVLQGFTPGEKEEDEPTLQELHFFLGPDWLITVHTNECQPVERAWQRVEGDVELIKGRGVDFFLYLCADALMDEAFPLLDELNESIEALEDEIFEMPRPAQLQTMFALKRRLVRMRRVLSPQRDVVGMLSRVGGVPYVQERTTLYFRDVHDHLIRLYEQIDSARDILANGMEGYLSVVANRTGEVTKQLTIFATIFLPLSFITGFFGQNFNELQSHWFFLLMLGLMVALPAGLLLWFWRKGWL
jgi:magnesium transporter